MASEDIQRIANEAVAECNRARTLHQSMNSPHEAYGVIVEEVDEFFDEVRANNVFSMKHELIQIAAMAIRAIHDLRLS